MAAVGTSDVITSVSANLLVNLLVSEHLGQNLGAWCLKFNLKPGTQNPALSLPCTFPLYNREEVLPIQIHMCPQNVYFITS
jgi:hypothetical protein